MAERIIIESVKDAIAVGSTIAESAKKRDLVAYPTCYVDLRWSIWFDRKVQDADRTRRANAGDH